jgi:Na+/H+ antiporter NhaD/arsenite permease-like protein
MVLETGTGTTANIKNWKSIITLVVFVITNVNVLFPFHIPIFVPRPIWNLVANFLSTCRVIAPRPNRGPDNDSKENDGGKRDKPFVRLNFPMNFVTAPLIADLFLLAITAIGRKEVHDGTIGTDSIHPYDIMIFFLSLAYIAISIDASGLIRYLAFKVLLWGGDVGHRLFFYLYAFFFGLTTFMGNDPIILSGTAFLAYMTRVSSNIVHPRAWIHTQFACANIASAILVSSNPTNLVLAGAFGIKFINYTANVIVPVVATGIVLFPFLLYIVFADEALIPISIKMHELPEEVRGKPPINPNIPHARGNAEEQEKDLINDDETKLLSLEEIMNPFVDKKGAAFGAILMAATLVAVLALNGATQGTGEHPVFYVTLPASIIMLVFDITWGWLHRVETRKIASKGREAVRYAQAEKKIREAEVEKQAVPSQSEQDTESTFEPGSFAETYLPEIVADGSNTNITDGNGQGLELKAIVPHQPPKHMSGLTSAEMMDEKHHEEEVHTLVMQELQHQSEEKMRQPQTLASFISDSYAWAQETFPTATTVLAHLPFALVPFAFSMFVLVQALVTKGWIPVFAHGWDHWVEKTGTVGAIGGMGFLSVVLCNFTGTNIGTSILLSRLIQAWQSIHHINGIPITNRTFWATVYSMALGVNYGAFSAAFSASLAGLLWRDILARKHIRVRSLDFARVNLPIIAISMTVGCVVLVGQVYIIRDNSPYDAP